MERATLRPTPRVTKTTTASALPRKGQEEGAWPLPQSSRGWGFPSDLARRSGSPQIHRGLGVTVLEHPRSALVPVPLSKLTTHGWELYSWVQSQILCGPSQGPGFCSTTYGQAEEHLLLYSLRDSLLLLCPFKWLVARQAGWTVPPRASWWGRNLRLTGTHA